MNCTDGESDLAESDQNQQNQTHDGMDSERCTSWARYHLRH